MDDAAEPVSSEHADARPRTRLCAACGRALVQGSVRSVRVEMLHILAQHDVEMAWSGDQEVVEAFPAQGAETLRMGTSRCGREPFCPIRSIRCLAA